MDPNQINQTTDLLSLVEGNLRKSGTYHVGACPFCGGTDRFTIKHTTDGDRWYCRHCGDDKYHTAIDFIMRRDNVDFKVAYTILAGGNLDSTQRQVKPYAKTLPKQINLPSDEWQAKAIQYMETASDRLLDSDDGYLGREYLLRRGLSRAVWMAWHLGFSMEWDPQVRRTRSAIVIPWLDMDSKTEVITAIKYRFIENIPGGLRYISMAGSVPLLFGLWDVLDSDKTLMLVEGEINALSIWQCRPRGVSVLSFGSQSGGSRRALQALARRYPLVCIWCDDPDRTQHYQSKLARPCSKLKSPDRDGVKWDANKMLQDGVLMGFLSQLLKVECLGVTHPS